MRAVVYLRISQDRTGNGLAVERQRKDCYRIAEQRGWQVVREYADTESASDKHKRRPQYDAMVEAYRRGEFDALVCWDLDRLTRQPRQLEDWIDAAEERGLAIVTANGEADLSNDNGRLFARIKASVARGEVERKASRQRSGHQQRAEKGSPPDRRAFGYHQDGTIHPVEGSAVQKVFSMFLGGASVIGVTRWLNEQGFHTTTCRCPRCAPNLERKDTVTDEQWAKIRTERRWERVSVRYLLGNLRYAGIRTYKGQEVHEGEWEPLVPEETVRAVIGILNDSDRRLKQPQQARKWLGAKLYRCGKCAERGVESVLRVGYSGAGRRRRRVYRCAVYDNFGGKSGCGMVRAAERVDELVEKVVVAKLRAENIGELLVERAPDLEPLYAEARGLRTRIGQLADDIGLDEMTLARRTKALHKRLDEIKAAVGEAGRRSALASIADEPDPGRAWLDLDDVSAKQAVVRELYTVTLLPVRRGTNTFDPETVMFEPPGQVS